MTVNKKPIIPHLVRLVPDQFSWVDHRFIGEYYIDQLSHQAATLYLFLVTVGDSRGLSYYGDMTLCKRLQMNTAELVGARNVLVDQKLVAYQKPLYQVLALEQRRSSVQTDAELTSLGQILQQMSRGAR